jgi:hypothetical protein
VEESKSAASTGRLTTYFLAYFYAHSNGCHILSIAFNSTAAALAAHYLSSELPKRTIIQNAGSIRVLVLEASAGTVIFWCVYVYILSVMLYLFIYLFVRVYYT